MPDDSPIRPHDWTVPPLEGSGPSASSLLSALQPNALFVLDAGQRVLEVGGTWATLTGTSVREAIGRPITEFVTLNLGCCPASWSTAHGLCERATVYTPVGARHARVSWRRVGTWTAGSIEPARAQAELLFHWELQLLELRTWLDAAVRCIGRSGGVWEANHVEQVVAFSVRLGEAIGLPASDLRALRWGAYLHDLGKVRVPDGILLKESALTPEERAQIEQHPRWGHEILASLPFLPIEVRDIVLHHHERWDGAGYPMGLVGDQIPLLARVVAVADVFEALTSERSYKVAWDYRDAVEYLRREAGQAFDPHLVDVFVTRVLRMNDRPA